MNEQLFEIKDSYNIEELDAQAFDVMIVNSIKKRYEEARNKSKAPTFALT